MTISFDELLLPWSIQNSGFNELRFSFCFRLAVISLLTVEENKAQFIRIFTQKSDMLALKIMTMITKILSTITAHMYWLHWIAGDRWIRCSFLQTCNTFSQHVCFVRLFCACVSYKLQNDGVRLCVCVFYLLLAERRPLIPPLCQLITHNAGQLFQNNPASVAAALWSLSNKRQSLL